MLKNGLAKRAEGIAVFIGIVVYLRTNRIEMQ